MFAIPDTHNDRGLTTKELPVNTLGSGRFAAFLLAATAAPEVLAQATHKHLRLYVEYPAALPDTAGALYQDNHVRVMLGCMGTATILGTDRWDEKLLINILANFRTTGLGTSLGVLVLAGRQRPGRGLV